ncbi:hypothetical protein ACP70R_006053 [Stipagrostis hirtigluma subsp. patula]
MLNQWLTGSRASISYKKLCNATSFPQNRSTSPASIGQEIYSSRSAVSRKSPALSAASSNKCRSFREMGMEGLVPFVCRAIKKRRATRRTTDYEFLSSSGGSPPPPTRRQPEDRFTGGGAHHHSQSCRFVVARSLADELDLWRHDGVRAPPEDLPAEAPLLPVAVDGGVVSRSRRFSSMRMLGCASSAQESDAFL